jgi:hypothetical protein
MKYEQWLGNPTRFLAMTGYTPALFHQLLPYFVEAHDAYLAKFTLDGQRRSGLRRFVLYANSPLPTHAERLAFVLSFNKLNSIQELHADLFSITQKQCYQFLHGLTHILQLALQKAQVLPTESKEALSQQLEQLPHQSGQHLFHDGSEREVPRPQDADKQQENYSGKKKKHTVKNALLTTALCYILFVSPTLAGKVHDKKIADAYYKIPPGFTLWQDTGYQGYRPKGVLIRQPLKKPRGKQLSLEQKAYNQAVSSIRVRIEHAIGSVKRYRIVKDECRLRRNNFVGSIFRICAALHNFRIQQCPCKYPEINLT